MILVIKKAICADDLIWEDLFCSEQSWKNEIAAWAGDRFGQLRLAGSFRLSYNGSLFAREGLGILLTFRNLIFCTKENGLVSRPLIPGSMILSVGSYGCNLSCPFCQNYEISMAGESDFRILQEVSPQKLCSLAMREASRGNVGVAYTYNEALTGYEYVRDSARLVHEAGMVNVLVTNGMAELPVLEELLPYIDAMNIDLKCFRPEIYRKLGGDLETVKAFISRAAQNCHVELTSLIVPGLNDDPADMERQAEWIAQIDPRMPLHLTRYFPRYRMHEKPTELSLLTRLKKVAQKSLERVLLGNV